ncbi:MAG: CHASE domain-containing protein [Spongiibacteraceae bacterium]
MDKQEAVLEKEVIDQERRALERAGRLHWVHWLVIGSSLLLTLFIWQYARLQVQEKVNIRFSREADQLVSLTLERLQKYEDALWAGVATMKSHDDDMSFDDWKAFADALNLGEKYKGINGIGVIHLVERDRYQQYLDVQRRSRPDYKTHPEHDENILLPITYIVPVAENAAAVGLDMAHEKNRLTAAIMASDTGRAQITAPIVLVQDAQHTPGFLFYAPFYRSEPDSIIAPQSRTEFAGLVYAPFVANKLMRGTLEKARRQLGVSIFDGGDVLYDEGADGDFALLPGSSLKREYTLSVYGRDWTVRTWATLSFLREEQSAQPFLILMGGLIVNTMLLVLFLLLSRSNRKAVAFASRMSENYQQKAEELQRSVKRLEASNEELEQFAFVASHDLQEPLLTLSNYVALLEKSIEGEQNERVNKSLRFIGEAAERMRSLVFGLMSYVRIGREPEAVGVDCAELMDEIIEDLGATIEESSAEIECSDLPEIHAYRLELRTLLQNLLSNAIKFGRDDCRPQIAVACKDCGEFWRFSVEDNGIGMAEEYRMQIFMLFKRLHSQDQFTGSGIGLANCKKIVNLHGGEIWVESIEGVGSKFIFTIPKQLAP